MKKRKKKERKKEKRNKKKERKKEKYYILTSVQTVGQLSRWMVQLSMAFHIMRKTNFQTFSV